MEKKWRWILWGMAQEENWGLEFRGYVVLLFSFFLKITKESENNWLEFCLDFLSWKSCFSQG